MDEKRFRERLSQLRTQKNVSAREMSLALGQNAGYINNIENGKNMPGMASFSNICDYLGITQAEFFDDSKEDPPLIRRINKYISLMNRSAQEGLAAFLEETTKRR